MDLSSEYRRLSNFVSTPKVCQQILISRGILSVCDEYRLTTSSTEDPKGLFDLIVTVDVEKKTYKTGCKKTQYSIDLANSPVSEKDDFFTTAPKGTTFYVEGCELKEENTFVWKNRSQAIIPSLRFVSHPELLGQKVGCGDITLGEALSVLKLNRVIVVGGKKFTQTTTKILMTSDPPGPPVVVLHKNRAIPGSRVKVEWKGDRSHKPESVFVPMEAFTMFVTSTLQKLSAADTVHRLREHRERAFGSKCNRKETDLLVVASPFETNDVLEKFIFFEAGVTPVFVPDSDQKQKQKQKQKRARDQDTKESASNKRARVESLVK